MKQKVRALAMIALLWIAPLATMYAQADNRTMIYGNVKDLATRRVIEGVTIDVMRLDSTIIAQGTTRPEGGMARTNNQLVNTFIRVGQRIRNERVLLRCTHPEYATLYHELKLVGQREYLFHFGDILLRRDNYQLDEVTIEATKIRMVAGKDTIVFNASEFQLAQGSMLDGLIRLLPGVQLDGSIPLLLS